MDDKGYLVLENGKIYEGLSFGYANEVFGEVVFNTGMVGYPEGLTDPSYYGQILLQTYPLIGNYGVPEYIKKDGIIEHFESDSIKIKGLVVSTYVDNNHHWQSKKTLAKWLISEKIPGLYGIDTRSITKFLRKYGVTKGYITFKRPRKISGSSFYDINKDNLVAQVSCAKPESYGRGRIKILLIDCGTKLNIIRKLLTYGTSVIRVPWNFDPFEQRNNIKYDGVIITNGPGDPKMVDDTIKIVGQILEKKIPTLGICLGNQILALAAGANTYKLKYGHRSQNQPVIDERSGKCYITSQNHGFAVETESLPEGWQPWFTNLNDGTSEGIRHQKDPFYSTQFHPEATPGPYDTTWIFKYFISKIDR